MSLFKIKIKKGLFWENITHKMKHNSIPNKLRQSWLHRRTGIISRCRNPLCKAYPNYGARGIDIYQAWVDDPKVWLAYIVTLEKWDVPGLDLDRIDNEKGYFPGNLRLVPRTDNSNNRRNTVKITVEGRSIPFCDFWKEYCPNWKSYNALTHHLAKGKTGDEIAAYYKRTQGSV